MLKQWKKPLKFFSTIIFLLVYITADRYSRETIRSEKNKKPLSVSTRSAKFPTSKDGFLSATLKTIVGYSREYKLKRELEDRIECDVEASMNELMGPRNGNGSLKNQWKRDRKLRINLYSAYYDRRQDPYYYVRIIGLLPRNLTLYCQVWYERPNETFGHVTLKAVVREIWSESWGQKSGHCEEDYPSLISCLAPTKNGSETLPPPSWVSFVDENCNGDGKTFLKIVFDPFSSKKPFATKKFLICVKPLNYTNNEFTTLQEWLEINKRLGAEKVVVYVSHTTQMNFSLFGETGQILEVKKFQAPVHENCPARNFEEFIWQKRKMEIIAYNDCFYSNLDQSEFVIPLDVDEIIVPKIGNNWFEAFSAHFRSSDGNDQISLPLKQYASFSVRNAYFFSSYPANAVLISGDTSSPETRKLPKITKSSVPVKLVNFFDRESKRFSGFRNRRSIFDRTVRSYRLSPETDSVKSFIKVTRTLSVFNHYAFHVLDNESVQRQYIFPENVFQLNHYRNSCDPILIDGCQNFLDSVVYDNLLQKFRNRSQ